MSSTHRGSSFALIASLTCAAALPAPSAAQAPTIRPAIAIGCESCDGPAQLTNIYDVVVGANGEVIVADRAEPMLRRFAPDGRLLWSGGRRGEGPGEFIYPMSLGPLAGGELRVLDLRARRITLLDREGAERASAPLTRFPGDGARVGETGAMLVLMDDFRSDYEIERWDPDATSGALVAKLPRPARPPGEPFVPPGIAVAPSGEIAVVVLPVQYRIHRFRPDGTRLPDIVRDVERPRRSEEEMARMRVLSGGGGSSRARAGGDTDGPRAFKPHIAQSGLEYDGAGRLWVHTYRGGEGTTIFDVFAPSGAFLGEVRVPMTASVFSLAGGWLAVGGEDEDGIPRVRVWAVR